MFNEARSARRLDLGAGAIVFAAVLVGVSGLGRRGECVQVRGSAGARFRFGARKKRERKNKKSVLCVCARACARACVRARAFATRRRIPVRVMVGLRALSG